MRRALNELQHFVKQIASVDCELCIPEKVPKGDFSDPTISEFTNVWCWDFSEEEKSTYNTDFYSM